MIDATAAGLYRRPADLFVNVAWQTLGQIVACGEIFLACHFLGEPVGLIDAFILQSLIRAIRAAAFFVPGGLGVQEGGTLFLSGLIGLSPETGLAIALVKRVRELVVGIPALVAWHAIEIRRPTG